MFRLYPQIKKGNKLWNRWKDHFFFLKFLRAGNSKVDKAATAMMELIITLGKLADSEQLPKYYQCYVQMRASEGMGRLFIQDKDTRETAGSQNRRWGKALFHRVVYFSPSNVNLCAWLSSIFIIWFILYRQSYSFTPSSKIWPISNFYKQTMAFPVSVSWCSYCCHFWTISALIVCYCCSVMPNSLQLHVLQHAGLHCPSPSPRVCSNSCPLNQWCHPTLSASVTPFSSCHQSFPASGPFLMSQPFTSDGQSIGVSASISVLPVNIQGWLSLGWTGLSFLQSKSLLQHHNLKAMLQCSVFFGVRFSHSYITTGNTIALTIQTFVVKVMSLLFITLIGLSNKIQVAQLRLSFR